MKKIFKLLLVAILSISYLTSCTATKPQNSGKLTVYTSFYTMKDFAQKIGGDKVDVTCMVPSGVEPHDYEPTPNDIVGLEKADVFVYNGSGMESWTDKVIPNLENKDIVLVSTSDAIPLIKNAHDHDHDHDDDDHDHDHDDDDHDHDHDDDDHDHDDDEHGHGHSHEKLTDEDVAERPISDFKGTWFGSTVLFKENRLDEFVAKKAELDGSKEEDVVKEFTKGVVYDTFNINDKGITYTTIDGAEIKGNYDFTKYIIDDHGATFVYKLVSGDEKAPKFISIGDHKTGKEEDKSRTEGYHLHVVVADEEDKVMDEDNMVGIYEDVDNNKDYVVGLYMKHVQNLIDKANEDDHDHDHDHDHGEFDPHVWLNPMFAKKQMEAIKDGFIKADPDNKDYYEANYLKYSQELDALDNEFKEGLKDLSDRNLVVSHEAFAYLCEAYDLNQMGIEGVMANSEPSPARMAKIIDFVKENKVKVIFSETLISPKVAEAIAKEANVKTALLDPIEGITDEAEKEGFEYFSIMRQNLKTLIEALK